MSWLLRLLRGPDDRDPREELAPEVRAAYDQAAAALPDGWELHRPDRERYRRGTARVAVWSVAATGPHQQVAVGAALDEAGAFGALARRLRGELDPEEGWAPPVGDNHRAGELPAAGGPAPAAGMSVEDLVRAEVEGLLPDGWSLDRPDRELYPTGLETWGVLASGPGGGLLLAVGRGGEVDGYQQLVRLLRGELPVRDLWSPY